jgi:tRNA pseudouridine55 synthase
MTNNYNGIVNVYKGKDFTSFDVVAKLRGIFGQRKIGHTGTLDPDATGVLPICLGNGTKVVELLMDHDKEYVAELLLGVKTDTLDIGGEVLEKRDASGITEEQVRDVIKNFIGEIDQVPPMYSAIKVNGQKLCNLARKGQVVEREARKVTVHEIEILDIKLPVIKMRVHCSKGTYIRTLCDDIGEKLGCGGCMQSLERTRVGIFGKEDALTLDEIQKLKDEDRLSEIVRPVDGLFEEYPKMVVTEEALKKLENGNVLADDDYVNSNTVNVQSCVRVYRPDMTFAGIYKKDPETNLYKPEKMFL